VTPGKASDAWFFATMAAESGFNINVEEDAELHATKLWINAVVADHGRRLGAAGTGLDLTAFVHDLIDSRETGVTAMLADPEGAIQAHPDTSLIAYGSGAEGRKTGATVQSLLDDPADRAALAAAMHRAADASGTVETLWATLRGQRQLLALAYIPELHWHLVAAIDLETARVFDLGLVGPTALVLLLLVGFLGVGFGSGVERFVLVPLRRLQESASSIAGGNYRAALPPPTRDEIGDLTRAFSTMADTVRRHTEELEERVRQRTAELTQANAEMATARRKIDDSIAYASLLQRSVLPSREAEEALGPDRLVIWEPRDVVGGDFWFVQAVGPNVLAGVFDCAGHGVAGALMTMLARSAIGEAIAALGPRDPGALLGSLDARLRSVLSDAQKSRGLAATTDAGLVWVDRESHTLAFAGARIPLLVVGPDGMVQLPAVRRSLAGRRIG
jgi:HAMP domain-containing protein